MEHYYTSDPTSKSDIKTFKVNLLGKEFTFFTDSGMFSRNRLDFGSRLLLENISNIHGKVLDIGCGYGVIGIILSSIYDIEATMADINERALSLAERNSKVNDVSIKIVKSNIYDNIKGRYDFIITNPPIRIGKKGVLKFLFEARNHLNKNGELWFVMRKKQGALSVVERLKNEYNVEIIKKRKGFCIIRAFSVDLKES